MREDHKQIMESISAFKKEFFSDKKNARIFLDKAKEYRRGVQELNQLIDGFLRESHRLKEDENGMNKIMVEVLKDQKKEWEVQYNKFERLHNFTLNEKKEIKEINLDNAKIIPVPEVMGVQYKTGRSNVQMFCCPLHNEKTPSFAWYPKQNRWHCFGACGRGGDAIDLYMLLNNCDFLTAVKQLNKY